MESKRNNAFFISVFWYTISMSDVFFIVSSICIVVITILLSLLLLKVINALDEVQQIVLKTKDVTESATKAIATVATIGGIISPALGVSSLFKKRRKKAS
jgi:hypothetical protein